MKTKLCLIFCLCISYAYSQVILPKDAPYDQLINFGKPLHKANTSMIGKFPSGKCDGGYTIILADYGEFQSNYTAPKECLKFIFIEVSPTFKKVDSVSVKDINGNTVNNAIGSFGATGGVKGLDNCLYMGTGNIGGGHLLKISYIDKTVTDLGVPHNFVGGTITTLTLGTDLSIHGIINPAYSMPAYTFRYEYGCGFTELDPNPIDPTTSITKILGADNTYLYARAEYDAEYKLIAINRQTFAKHEIQLSYNGMNINPTNPIEIETYTGDYVYARTSTFNYPNPGPVVYWKLQNGQVIDHQDASPKFITTRTNELWTEKHSAQIPATKEPVFDELTAILYYDINGVEDFVDLSAYLKKQYHTTSAIAPYVNAFSGNTELFVAGSKYSMASTINISNGEIERLGKTYESIYAATISSSTTNVIFAGYPDGRIVNYNSSNIWNIFNSTSSPNPNDPTATPTLNYTAHNILSSNNNTWGPSSIADIKKISPNLLIAGGECGRHFNLRDHEIGLSIIRTDLPSNQAITNISDQKFYDYTYHSMEVNDEKKLIFLVGFKSTPIPYKYLYHLFILNTSGVIIKEFDLLDPKGGTSLQLKTQVISYGDALYFGGLYERNEQNIVYDDCIFRITDYNVSTTPDRMCSTYDLGSFTNSSIGLSLDGKYLWTLCRLTSDGSGQFLYMPTSITNDSYSKSCNCFQSVTMVDGIIPPIEKDPVTVRLVYANSECQGYVLLSGRESIYGFKPSKYQGFGLSGKAIRNKKPLIETPVNQKSNIKTSSLNTNYK